VLGSRQKPQAVRVQVVESSEEQRGNNEEYEEMLNSMKSMKTKDLRTVTAKP
jgi:hypothetical protein